ncbi:MAG: putative intracellular protease/amidase [Hyphomicrobiaceae bacterium]|jgi:putative intracellular protease/amidase
MNIVIFLYDNMTALDVIGPYEVLARLPEAQVKFVAETKGVVRTDMKSLGLVADYSIDEIDSADIFLVGGGPGDPAVRENNRVIEWVQRIHETTTWTTSVCTGSLILAQAGLLNGKQATSHFAAIETLQELGAVAAGQRVVMDGKIVTGAGVSAGIDMALTLMARIAGEEFAQTIQLGIEYDPQPPFDTGSPEKASPEMVAVIKAVLAG